MTLQTKFYIRHAEQVAKDLIGKELFVKAENSEILAGIINETEAYHGFDDDACHGHKGKTPRCESLFEEGGLIYVYFTYGLHYMLNIVTSRKNIPSAVLIRSIIPTQGLSIMSFNRYSKKFEVLSINEVKNLANGPAKLASALGITQEKFNETKIGKYIWVKDNNVRFNKDNIEISPRIGINYATNSKNWMWRFYLNPTELTIKN